MVVPAWATGSSVGYNPLTAITWHHAFWASDPLWAHPADGGQIASWRDGSGNGRGATQALNYRRPSYRAAAPTMNGYPAVEGDGEASFLTTAAYTPVTGPLTVVAVASSGTFSTWSALWGLGADAGSVYNRGTDHWWFRTSEHEADSPIPATTLPHLFVNVLDTTSVLLVDQATSGNKTAGATTATQTTLFASDDALNAGLLAFWGLYPGDIRTAEPAKWLAFKAWAQSIYDVQAIG